MGCNQWSSFWCIHHSLRSGQSVDSTKAPHAWDNDAHASLQPNQGRYSMQRRETGHWCFPAGVINSTCLGRRPISVSLEQHLHYTLPPNSNTRLLTWRITTRLRNNFLSHSNQNPQLIKLAFSHRVIGKTPWITKTKRSVKTSPTQRSPSPLPFSVTEPSTAGHTTASGATRSTGRRPLLL